MYDLYPEIGKDPSNKSVNKMSLSVRNTIPWSLECELKEGLSREHGMSLFTLKMDVDADTGGEIELLSLVFIIVLSVLALFGFCGSLGVMAWKQEKTFIIWVLLATVRVLSCVFGFVLLTRVLKIQSVTDGNMERLESASTTNCSDEYTVLDTTGATSQMNDSSSYLTNAIVFICVPLGLSFVEAMAILISWIIRTEKEKRLARQAETRD